MRSVHLLQRRPLCGPPHEVSEHPGDQQDRCGPGGKNWARRLAVVVDNYARSFQTVEYPGTYRFRDWLSLHLTMSYAEVLARSLRIEVWQVSVISVMWLRSDSLSSIDSFDSQAQMCSPNTLLGCYTLPFAALLHSSPDQSISVPRNVASTRRGLSTSVGKITFRCQFEEASLHHELSFRHWSIALSSGLFSHSFKHATPCHCSSLCCCGAVVGCCATDNSCTRLIGCDESVVVNVRIRRTYCTFSP